LETICENQDMKVIKLTLGVWDTNCYIILNPPTNKSALIDVPAGAPTILKHLNGSELDWIILTHSHEDHIGGIEAVRAKRKSALVVHARDNQPWLPVKPDMDLNDQDRLFIGGLTVNVMHTPGHTPGSCSFLIGKYLFCGDTIFPGGPGHTDSPEEFQRIVKSITEKILVLADNVVVLPGHGPSTTIKKVKKEYTKFENRSHAANLCGDVTWESTQA
jgi:hydroxyacylglutathione hydrolase